MTPLLPEDTLGRKEYLAPTVTLLGGTPCKRIWVLAVPVPAAPVVAPLAVLIALTPLPQPERLTATSNARIKRYVIFREPLQVIGCEARGIANIRDK